MLPGSNRVKKEYTLKVEGGQSQTWKKLSRNMKGIMLLSEAYSDHSLRKKCPYSELLWSVFSRIWTEYGQIRRISPYSARMRENAGQNNSEYGYFSRSVIKHVRWNFLKN